MTGLSGLLKRNGPDHSGLLKRNGPDHSGLLKRNGPDHSGPGLKSLTYESPTPGAALLLLLLRGGFLLRGGLRGFLRSVLH